MIKPPSKDACLWMAEFYHDRKRRNYERLMWAYLFCHGWYDHWVEDWINAKVKK
jgi:hypothetical protein